MDLIPVYNFFVTAYLIMAGLLIVGLVYEIVMVSIRGQTLGKMLTGIKVVQSNNNLKPGWRRTIKRLKKPLIAVSVAVISFVFSMFSIVLSLVLSFFLDDYLPDNVLGLPFLPLFFSLPLSLIYCCILAACTYLGKSRQGQQEHDKASETLVIETKKSAGQSIELATADARITARFIDILLVSVVVVLVFWRFVAPIVLSESSHMRIDDGEPLNPPISPPKVPLKEVKEISAGAEHSCAVRSDNTLECWRDNIYGHLTRLMGLSTQCQPEIGIRVGYVQTVRSNAGAVTPTAYLTRLMGLSTQYRPAGDTRVEYAQTVRSNAGATTTMGRPSYPPELSTQYQPTDRTHLEYAQIAQ